MRWRWDRAPLKIDDPESVVGFMMVPAALLVVYLFYAFSPSESLRCAFREQYHLPCLSCGAYRSFGALLRGDVLEALRLQPLIVAVLLLGMAYVCYALAVALFGLPKLRVSEVSRRSLGLAALTAALLVLLNWLYLVAAGV